jgi:hypothetical protein
MPSPRQTADATDKARLSHSFFMWENQLHRHAFYAKKPHLQKSNL